MFVKNWNAYINDSTRVQDVVFCLVILGFNHIWIWYI